MAGAQKDQNRLALYSALVFNGVILYGLAAAHDLNPSVWLDLLSQAPH